MISKTIVINKEPTRCKIEMVSVSKEQVMETKYLEVAFSSYGVMEKEVRDQLQKTNRVAGCLITPYGETVTSKSIWNQEFTKQPAIRPIITYTSKTRPNIAKHRPYLKEGRSEYWDDHGKYTKGSNEE